VSFVYLVIDPGMRLPLAALLLKQLHAQLQDRERLVVYAGRWIATVPRSVISPRVPARRIFRCAFPMASSHLRQRIVLTRKTVGRPAPLPCAVHGLNFCASVLMMAPFSALTPDGLRKAAVAARHSRSQLQSHPSIARRTIGAASARWNERVTAVIRCQGRSSRNSERARLCDASSSTAHGAGPVRRQVQREQWSL